LLSVALHEMGHAYIAWRYKVAFDQITLSHYSFVRLLSDSTDPDTLIRIALAGPLAGILPGIVFFFADLSWYGTYDIWSWLTRSIICIADILQFLPVHPLDGGHIYDARLKKRLGDEAEALIKERDQRIRRSMSSVVRWLFPIFKILFALLMIIVCALIYLFIREMYVG